MMQKLELPSGWKKTTLGRVAKFGSGATKPSDISEVNSGGKYPVYGGNGIIGYSSEFNSEGPEIIIGRVGEKCGCVHVSKGACWVTDNALRIKDKYTEVYPHFFAEALKKARLENFRAKGGQPLVTQTGISGVPINLPPLPEQKAIATLLSTWDEAIDKTERLIQAKEKRFKWLLRELISEPRNTQKNAKWKRVNIGAFLTESRISGTNGRDAQKITVKLYGKGVLAKDEKRIGSETTQYYVRKSGQFIYSKLDFLNGAFGIIPEELDCFESTLDLPAFDIADSVSKEWFLYYLIRPEYYTRQLGLAKGQRKARRVNPSEFLNSKIPFPPLEVQKQIAETLSSAQHEIDLLKQLSEKYKTQKRGLMQRLLTGDWRIKWLSF